MSAKLVTNGIRIHARTNQRCTLDEVVAIFERREFFSAMTEC